jgi:hypothetical protein
MGLALKAVMLGLASVIAAHKMNEPRRAVACFFFALMGIGTLVGGNRLWLKNRRR